MKSYKIFVLTCIVAALVATTSADGPCDEIVIGQWGTGAEKTCKMSITTINSTNFLITSDRDEAVDGFWANGNEQLKYLPENLGKKLPNLINMQVMFCSVKEVSKDNFKGINKLRILNLQGNEIKKIDDDTFEYIPAIEWISLAVNEIKKLNGRAFAPLTKLRQVWLNDNKCIDEYFETARRIAEMPRVIDGKCGFAS